MKREYVLFKQDGEVYRAILMNGEFWSLCKRTGQLQYWKKVKHKIAVPIWDRYNSEAKAA